MDSYKRRNSRKKYPSVDSGSLQFFVPYLIASVIMVLLVFILAAAVYMITPIPSTVLPYISIITVIGIELLVAYFVGKVSKLPGLISGAIYGLGFTVIFILIGFIARALSIFSLKFLLVFFTGIFCGIIGALIGDMRPRRRRRRRR